MVLGEIAMVKVKVVPINEIISRTVSNIQRKINNTGEVKAQMNIGKATRDSIFIQCWAEILY